MPVMWPAPRLAGQLTVWDFKHRLPVRITFEDQKSSLVFYDAFYRREGRWTVVYTEHFGYLTFLTASIAKITGKTRRKPSARSVRYWTERYAASIVRSQPGVGKTVKV